MPVERMNYMGIANDLAARIESGEYPPGSQLPSVARLSELYSVGQSTVTRATAILRDRGLIYGEQGRGMFVANR